MRREFNLKVIKFRKFDQLQIDFSYSHRVDGDTSTVFDFEPSDDTENWVGARKSHELMQYTGVHDCVGKPIYEGDIVQIKGLNSDERPVYFDHGKFVPVYQYSAKDLKIIGHVFH